MKRAFTYLGCNMNFLRDIFGWQHFEIYFSVMVCILMSILLCTCLTTGHSYKVSTNCLHGRIVSSHYTQHYFRKRFPNNILLEYLKLALKDGICVYVPICTMLSDLPLKLWKQIKGFGLSLAHTCNHATLALHMEHTSFCTTSNPPNHLILRTCPNSSQLVYSCTE